VKENLKLTVSAITIAIFAQQFVNDMMYLETILETTMKQHPP
jgi:hypothetical protein